jgi:hypothetical protein
VAVERILSYNSEARFVAMVRSPITMAPSLHRQKLFSGHEDVPDFERAWALQDLRRRGQARPPACPELRHLLYGDICSLGRQIERLLRTAPRGRVFISLLDDWKSDPRAEWLRLLAFLGLRDDGRTNFEIFNPAKARRFPALHRLAVSLGDIKRRMGIHGSLGVLSILERLNRKAPDRQVVSPEMTSRLKAYSRDDVALLSRILDRDLMHWVS